MSSGLWSVAAFYDESVSDGTIVEEAGDRGPATMWDVSESDAGLAHIAIAQEALPEQPNLWFVWVDEPAATPPAANLVAFSTDRFPAGTVVSKYTFATARVPNSEQVGAVRWYPGSGLVHQIFVAPEWRRRFVASTLLYAADAFHQANGWTGKLHGDGRRTALGQLFTAALHHPGRIQNLTHEMPPMDPANDPRE